jgi:hypothetical protein
MHIINPCVLYQLDLDALRPPQELVDEVTKDNAAYAPQKAGMSLHPLMYVCPH